ncbi:MAG: transposase [Moraxellaceae bacterium]|nr:transposase [Moraxellaceae bacterium]
MDDYGGYKALFEATNGGQATANGSGCWAHIRRKFF